MEEAAEGGEEVEKGEKSAKKAKKSEVPEEKQPLPLVRLVREDLVYKRFQGQSFELLAETTNKDTGEPMCNVRSPHKLTVVQLPSRLLVRDDFFGIKPKPLNNLMMSKGQGKETYRWLIKMLGMGEQPQSEEIELLTEKTKDTSQQHLQLYGTICEWTYELQGSEHKVCVFPVQLTSPVVRTVSQIVRGEDVSEEEKIILGKQVKYLRGMVAKVPVKLYQMHGSHPDHVTLLAQEAQGTLRYYDSLKKEHKECRENAQRMLHIVSQDVFCSFCKLFICLYKLPISFYNCLSASDQLICIAFDSCYTCVINPV